MNARGKPLTNFENFKAKFEQLLIDYDIEQNTGYSELFKNKIDNDWADVFWDFRGEDSNLFDQEFMNFVKVVLTCSFASYSDEKSNLIGYMVRSQNDLSFYDLNKYGVFADDKSIEDLISFLCLIEKRKKFRIYLKNNETIDEKQLFIDVINYDLTYIKRLQFYALYKFIQFNKANEKIDEWMRVIRNLTANSVYRQSDTFEIAIKSIDQMLPYSKKILNFFINGNKPKGFLGFQLEEEKLKSCLIKKSIEWEKAIKEIENHKYFNGQIEFLLHFAGVSNFFNEHGNVDWPEHEDENYLKKFTLYSRTASVFFNNTGLKQLPDFIFERALLTYGNYTLTKGRNNSFLVNNDREIGWKRLLRDSENKKRHFVKRLFDDIDIKIPIEKQLEELIKTSDTKDWRRYFIKYPETIRVCGKDKLFRVGPNFGYLDILLLERKQTNGKHREYFTFGLKCQLEEMGHTVSYAAATSVDDWKYISSINNIDITIKFWQLDDSDKLGFIVANDNNHFETEYENDVLDYLNEKNII